MNKIIGDNIRKWRKKRKLSQEDLAQVLGVHQTAMCRIERGRQGLSAIQAVALKKTLKITDRELFRLVLIT